jgi:hypothetical protein
MRLIIVVLLAFGSLGCDKIKDPVAPAYVTPTPVPAATQTPAPPPKLTPTPTPTVGSPDSKTERAMTFIVEDRATGARCANAGLDFRNISTGVLVHVALPSGMATLVMKDGEYTFSLGTPGYQLLTGQIIVSYAWQTITFQMAAR